MSESNGTAVADAPEQTQADTQVTQGDEQSEADALLDELTATEADKGSGTEGEGEDTSSEADELADAAIEARAAEIAEQKAQELAKEQEAKRKADEEKAARKAETEGVDKAFRDRVAALRDYLAGRLADTNGFKLEVPLPQDAINTAAHLLELHHAQASQVAQRQMQRDLIAAAGLEDYEWTDAQTFISDVAEARKGELTKGLISEKKANSEKALALLKHEKRLATDPEYREQRFGRYNGAPDRQAPGGGGGLTIQTLRNATPEQYEKLKEQYGSEAISRVYMQAANQ